MSKRMFVICVAMIALFSAVVGAKEVKFRDGDHGLVDVVRRECLSVLWTSEAMRLTPLDSSMLTKLKVGDPIVVPDTCRKERPAAEVREATLRLFKDPSAFQFQRISEPQQSQDVTTQAGHGMQDVAQPGGMTELETFKAELASASPAELASLNVALKKSHMKQADPQPEDVAPEAEDLKSEVAALKTAVSLAEKSSSSLWLNLVISCILGPVLTFAVVWLLVVQRMKRDVVALEQERTALAMALTYLRETQDEPAKLLASKRESVTSDGIVVCVPFEGEEVGLRATTRYACPYCAENNLKLENAESHLGRCIPKFRAKMSARVIDNAEESVVGVLRASAAG